MLDQISVIIFEESPDELPEEFHGRIFGKIPRIILGEPLNESMDSLRRN